MAEDLKRGRPVLPAEELLEDVEELLQIAAERGKAAEAEALRRGEGRRAGKVVRRLPDKPPVESQLRAALLSALEEEVVVASPTGERGGIDEREWRREIAKKAVLQLNAGTLRRIAEEHALDKRGTREDLAERIARAYGFDFHRIAELVLNNEDEPRPERGVTERLYPLLEAHGDLDVVQQRLAVFKGRYIKVGTAQWFIFDDVQRDRSRLVVRGTLRAYQAVVTDEEGEADLAWRPEESRVRLFLREGERQVAVRSRTASAAESGIRALERADVAAGHQRVRLDPGIRSGPLAQWDPRSVFMLDLLHARLNTKGVAIHDVTIAQFETDQFDSDDDPIPRPRVRSVRFEGDHLLSSVQACELLVAGRGLVNMSFWIRFEPSTGESNLLPVRISLHRDHIAVLTGFGPSGPEVARSAHDRLSERVREALEHGVSDDAALTRLAGQIEQRAKHLGPVDRADILAPPAESDDS